MEEERKPNQSKEDSWKECEREGRNFIKQGLTYFAVYMAIWTAGIFAINYGNNSRFPNEPKNSSAVNRVEPSRLELVEGIGAAIQPQAYPQYRIITSEVEQH